MVYTRILIYLLLGVFFSGWKSIAENRNADLLCEESSMKFVQKDTFLLLKEDVKSALTFYTGTDFRVSIQVDSMIKQFKNDLNEGNFILESQLKEWIDRLEGSFALNGKVDVKKGEMEKYYNVFSAKWLHEHLRYFLENDLVFVTDVKNGKVIENAIVYAHARGSKQVLSFVTVNGNEIINTVKYRICF